MVLNSFESGPKLLKKRRNVAFWLYFSCMTLPFLILEIGDSICVADNIAMRKFDVL